MVPAPPLELCRPGPLSLLNAWGGTSERRGGEGLLGGWVRGAPGLSCRVRKGAAGLVEGGEVHGGMEAQSGLGRVTERTRGHLLLGVCESPISTSRCPSLNRERGARPPQAPHNLAPDLLSLGGLAGRCGQRAAVVGPEPH